MKTSVVRFGLALGMVVAMASAATAAVTMNGSEPFNSPTLVSLGNGQTIVTDFQSPYVAAGYSFAYSGIDTGYYTGLTPNIAAAPAGDSTQYFAVATGGIGTLTSAHTLTSLSILIGSIDQYNLITFNGAGGFSQSFNGSQLYAPANGDQSSGATNRQFEFDFDAADRVNQVVFSSSGNSFEFDNIAAAVAVPEPATWALLLMGFGMIGWILRRTRRRERPLRNYFKARLLIVNWRA